MALRGRVDDDNSVTGYALGAGETWTGEWSEAYDWAAIGVRCTTSGAASLWVDFSYDRSIVNNVRLSAGTAALSGVFRNLVPTAAWYRIRVVDESAAPNTVTVQVLCHPHSRISLPTSRLSQTLDDYSDVLNTRAALFGETTGGLYQSIEVGNHGGLSVSITDPVGVYGEAVTTKLIPRVQIDGIYGIVDTDHQTFSATGGSVSAADSVITCATGTSVGGYGVVRSRRIARYRPGQGMTLRFSAAFPDGGAANCFLLAGGVNAEDAVGVGYTGTSFGLIRRIPGRAHIVRLTVSAGAGGAETITVTLDGVAFTVAAGGALSTAATAELIAERVGGYTGWSSAKSNGSTVVFVQSTPAVSAGAYSISSTGTAAGSFATLQNGAANDNTTAFVPAASFSDDPLDGTGPSGMIIDPTKINEYEIDLSPHRIELHVMDGGGRWVHAHITELNNTQTTVGLRAPSFRVGWVAASLGSTTNLRVIGSHAAGFVNGEVGPVRNPFGASAVVGTAGTTEYVALALRVRDEFAGVINHRVVEINEIAGAIDSSNRILRVRVVVNPTLTGTVDWQYIDQSNSVVEYATPSSIAPSGGTQVAFASITTQQRIDLSRLDLRIQPGDVLVIAVSTATSTSGAAVSANWVEV